MKPIPYFILLFSVLTTCQKSEVKENMEKSSFNQEAYWDGGVTYEVFVQSFCDSNGDGIGDINGLTSKLDYISDLGAEAIWLMPIHPSPTYHKYDVVDYYGIHPDYGTLEDFKNLVSEARKRNLKIIIDLVINHTSSEHTWFKESIKGKDNPYRNFYIWADLDTTKQLGETKEVTGDSDNLYLWNEAQGNTERYFGFFWHTMPDLNFDEPKVRREVFEIGKFWLDEIGIDGFRLDAARHIYPEDRIDDSVTWWEEFRREMQKIKSDVFLVGEVWGEAKDVAPFLKGLHSIFNFDQCFALQEMLKKEKTQGFLDTLFKTYNYYNSATESYYDGIFTTNHDQNRILSELENDVSKGKLAASVMLTLPGSPFIYYGEELGMLGIKPDEQIREPFPWGINESSTTSWREVIYNTTENTKPFNEQVKDSNSLYNHYRKLIYLRKESPILRKGIIEAINTTEEALLAYKRIHTSGELTILHNVSKKPINFSNEGKYKTIFSTKDGLEFSGEIPAYHTFIIQQKD